MDKCPLCKGTKKITTDLHQIDCYLCKEQDSNFAIPKLKEDFMIDRYTLYIKDKDGNDIMDMVKDEDGEWVDYDDYIKEKDSNVVNPLLCDVLAELEEINLIEDHVTLELDRERLKEVLSKYFT